MLRQRFLSFLFIWERKGFLRFLLVLFLLLVDIYIISHILWIYGLQLLPGEGIYYIFEKRLGFKSLLQNVYIFSVVVIYSLSFAHNFFVLF